MTAPFDIVRERLEAAQADALRVYKLDRDKPSGAFASGRYDGLKQAIAILNDLTRIRS